MSHLEIMARSALTGFPLRAEEIDAILEIDGVLCSPPTLKERRFGDG